MDSLSQVVLGAITFAVVKDKEIGKKSLVYGAVLGTIPDLDVFLNPFFDSVQQLAIHRAFSHSIFFSILLSLLVAKIFSKNIIPVIFLGFGRAFYRFLHILY